MRLFSRRKKKQNQPAAPDLKTQFPDVPDSVIETMERVKDKTMTSPQRIISLCDVMTHVSKHNIPGSIVECGVWRGGSMMAAALTLANENDFSRDLWLYDTFDGMTEPTADDVDNWGRTAEDQLEQEDRDDAKSVWCVSQLDEVTQNIESTGYPLDKVHFVKGPVEDTIPGKAPEKIAVLRLDTDWYSSTHHELVHLFPRITPGGVLIIDDYGHWKGCRKAVDEYFAERGISILLNRIDYTGRVGVVTADMVS